MGWHARSVLPFPTRPPPLQPSCSTPRHEIRTQPARRTFGGASLTFLAGSVLGAGMAPLMTTWLVGLDNGGGTNNIAWYFIGLITA